MKNLKRISLILVLVLMLVFFVGCGEASDSGNNKEVSGANNVSDEEGKDKTEGQDEVEEELASEDMSVDEEVLFDEEGITITLKSLELDGIFGPSLRVLVENNTEDPITVQARDSSVNGVMVDAMFSCDVAPNKKANDEITLESSTLEIAGITKLRDIELKFHILDGDSWDTIKDTEVITITTTVDSSYTQTYNDEGFVAFDEEDLKIVMSKLDNEDSFWGADIYLYIENNRDQDITIQSRDVSINGTMIDPIFSSEIVAGKKAYDTITFLDSDLEDNDITSIDSMDLKFHIFDSDSWDGILDSSVIEVVFD